MAPITNHPPPSVPPPAHPPPRHRAHPPHRAAPPARHRAVGVPGAVRGDRWVAGLCSSTAQLGCTVQNQRRLREGSARWEQVSESSREVCLQSILHRCIGPASVPHRCSCTPRCRSCPPPALAQPSATRRALTARFSPLRRLGAGWPGGRPHLRLRRRLCALPHRPVHAGCRVAGVCGGAAPVGGPGRAACWARRRR